MQTVQLPRPDGPLGIQRWGSWRLLDGDTSQPIRVEDIFLHHILGYANNRHSRSEFYTGTSNDLTTWGPDLPDGYVQHLPKASEIVATFHIVVIRPTGASVILEYTVDYYPIAELPSGTKIVNSVVFPQNYNVPIVELNPEVDPDLPGFVSSTHVYEVPVKFTEAMHLIAIRGHLHQGGKTWTFSRVADDSKPAETLCHAVSHYSSTHQAYYDEWAPQCMDRQPMTRQLYDGISFCWLMSPVPVLPEQSFKIRARCLFSNATSLSLNDNDLFPPHFADDGDCGYNDVMAWGFLYLAPDAQPEFESLL